LPKKPDQENTGEKVGVIYGRAEFRMKGEGTAGSFLAVAGPQNDPGRTKEAPGVSKGKKKKIEKRRQDTANRQKMKGPGPPNKGN